MHEAGETLVDLVWSHRPNAHPTLRAGQDYPVTSPEAQALSSALRNRGWKFVGPTIVYAFMQAVGMVNDHLVTCHRHKPLAK